MLQLTSSFARPFGAATTPIEAYRSKAAALAQGATAPNQVVGIHLGAQTGRVYQYYDVDTTNDIYGELTEDPGLFVYVAMYRSGELIEEAYFAGKEKPDAVVTTVTKTKSLVPWVVGGTVAVIAVGGAILLARRH